MDAPAYNPENYQVFVGDRPSRADPLVDPRVDPLVDPRVELEEDPEPHPKRARSLSGCPGSSTDLAPDTSESSEDLRDLADQVYTDDLYIMRYSFSRDFVKIGRSRDPERLRQDLGIGHAFRVQLVATFPGRGYLEGRLHRELAPHRNMDGVGHDWFNISVGYALHRIAELVHMDQP
jgi:hypothetical protein